MRGPIIQHENSTDDTASHHTRTWRTRGVYHDELPSAAPRPSIARLLSPGPRSVVSGC